MTDAAKIIKRFEHAKKRKHLWEETYRDAMEYAAPQRETFWEETKGDAKDGGQLVFDSTAQDAVMSGVSNLHSSLTPPMKRWIELKPGPQLEGDKQLAAALENITDVMFSHLHNSNFDTQVTESYHDLFFGTGALLVFEGDVNEPFRFVNVPLSQLYLEEGPHGKITTAFRCFELSARNIKEQWPDANIPEELMDIVKENPDEELKFIEATIPATVEVLNRKTGELEVVEGFKYYVISDRGNHTIVERELKTSPWIIFRWANLPGRFTVVVLC